ncbi:Peroxisomal membrane protein PEX29 [Cyphellophora attinorum]|uniref:Peroxisomal membrane protein PEX29 n=1 Tax=Cyphellophora attinorum TaxID=1664694 RepID=A0A0N1P2F0_9EURO|nr:Peroxisomal membrane protein PEX29 [Phialophora attinorum]KPI43623.1 Peroxisomal membrane protein PEX29 [Phialophora attinorum]
MDEYTVDAFANRDEALPLLVVPGSDDEISVSDTDSVASSASRRDRLKQKASPSRLKEKAQERQAERAEEGKSASLQDRLFAKIISQAFPADIIDDEDDTPTKDRRSSKYVSRPAFSMMVMANNFRRFNARIGIVFVFENQMIRLFTWRHPTHTLSLLATYTFVCLNPYLLAVLPLAVVTLFIMIPAFMSRHPPPPAQTHTSATTPYYATYTGPAIAPARTIKPASETSKDFVRNMRDLQNSMADFSNAHDTLVALIAPATNFSDEILSSTIFLYLFFLTLALFIAAHLFPWRLIILTAGYALIISGHPSAQSWLHKHQKSFLRGSSSTSIRESIKSTQQKPAVFDAMLNALPTPPASLHPLITSLNTMTLSSQPPTALVEIFELQHQWQPHLFTPTPYDPLSPSRIAGDRPRGTRFFEEVQPPKGWEWGSKKWELDLEAGEWVNERLVVGVEFGVSGSEEAGVNDIPAGRSEDVAGGDGLGPLQRRSSGGAYNGWVWDLPPPPGQGGREEEVWLAYGEYDVPRRSGRG